MAYEESEGSEDSDMEDLQTPNFPPEKPPNLVLYYIVDNRDRGLTYEESEGSEDSDMEDLQTPNFPPEKPPNLVLYYIVDNRDRGLTDEELRTEFREKIGKQEKQKWKTKHKKANKRYHKLLQLYLDANPDFDENQIQQRASPRKRTSKSTRKRIRNSYGSRQQNVFINTYDDDMNEYQPQAAKKRRKSHDNINNSSSIDDLFREINSGTKRVIRDPDKFKPTDENKRQMRDLINKMREAARHDWQCNKKSEPAINTSLMLEVVVSELSKKLFYKYYLDDTDLLEAVRDWIHPLPDGSLPALKIRTECYRIIEKLQLHDLEKQSLDHYLQVSEDKSRDQNYASDVHPNLKSFSKTCMNLWG
eukprot:327052_1